MFSRIGRRFIDLTPATSHEVTAVCLANGLNAEAAISKVLADARTVVSKAANPWDKKQVRDYYDMRRVRKSVHKVKSSLKSRNSLVQKQFKWAGHYLQNRF